jgi:hypothetical protein
MSRSILLATLLIAAIAPLYAAVDPALLALVPPGSKVVAGIDFERARSSPFGQFITSRMNSTDANMAQFIADTGFDPRKDLQQAVIAATEPSGKGDPSKAAILARGNFDQERIKAAASAKGIRPQSFQGLDLFIDKSQHDGPNAFAFLGDGIGVMGDSETVKLVIANRETGAPLDPALQAAVSKAGTDNDAWFVSLLSGGGFLSHHLDTQVNGGEAKQETQPDAKLAFTQSQALQSVLQSSGGIQFGSIVRVSFDALTRSPQDAASLADVVRFFSSMVQMQRQKDPRAGIAATAFDNMDLKTDGDALHLSLSIPEKDLEQLVQSIPTAVSADPHTHAAHPHAQ